MTQKEQLLHLFHENHNRITLGQIMQTTLAAEYRARITELRRQGYVILCFKGKRPSENVYELMTEPQDRAPAYVFLGEQGEFRLAGNQ